MSDSYACCAAEPGSLERRAEARRLTHLMEGQTPFTYLRLGDGELPLLLQWQNGETPSAVRKTERGIDQAYSVNGLRLENYPDLLNAFERCNYLDTYERVQYSAQNLRRLRLIRNPQGTSSPHPSLTQIFYEWVFYEFPQYISRHRCVIAGAEGPLLRELLADTAYMASTHNFWPPTSNITCVGIHNRGREYWNNLSRIKNDLVDAIRTFDADTLFLSLASGAKILCQQIAEELNVKCFDLGAMLLGLTYSATPANSLARNSHSPYIFRVPIEVYVPALQRAYPELSSLEIAIKAQAQLCLELIKKEKMNSYQPEICDPNSLDPSAESIDNFCIARGYFLELLARSDVKESAKRRLLRELDDWCLDRDLSIPVSYLSAVRWWGIKVARKARSTFHTTLSIGRLRTN